MTDAQDCDRDRRQFARTPVRLRAVCATGEESSGGMVRDLSLGGAFIQSPTPQPVGTRVRIGLMLPGRQGEAEWVEGRVARVVDVVPQGSVPGVVTGMGVEFQLTHVQRERLARLLTSRSSAPPSEAVRAPAAQEAVSARVVPATPVGGVPSVPAAASGAADEPGDEPTLRLDRMRVGQSRSVRLRLTAVEGRERRPTDHFLQVKVFCQAPGGVCEADVKADFEGKLPGAATVTVLKDRYEATSSLPLVEGGRCLEQEIPLRLGPGVEKLVFWIATDGGAGVPEQLACAIRVHSPAAEEPAEDLDTMRLPSIKTILSQNLAEVLRQAPVPSLVLLGELMETGRLAGKMRLLGRLVAMCPDVRILEAAVRDIELWERVAKGFGRVDFASLSRHDPVHASVVVFHPHSAPRQLAQVFEAAFGRHLSERSPEVAAYWGRLAMAAAMALRRRDAAMLDEALAAMREKSPPDGLPRLEVLVETAGRNVSVTPVDLSARLGDYAEDIRGRTSRPPLQAAVEFMAAVGFITPSTRLE